MKSLQNILFLSAFLLMVSFFSCSKDSGSDKSSVSVAADQYRGDVSNEWYSLIMEIDRFSPGYRPPAASRAFGYTGLAAYEAAVAGMPEHNSLLNSFPGLTLPELSTKPLPLGSIRQRGLCQYAKVFTRISLLHIKLK